MPRGVGLNFALFSAHATRARLCLFDSADATTESVRVILPEHTDMVWHGHLPDAMPSQLSWYRVHGPHEPAQGHSFNSNKIVMNPYAKSVARTVTWADEVFGSRVGSEEADLSLDERDSAAHAPLAAVVDPSFTRGDDRPLRAPWHNTVIYEMHVQPTGVSTHPTRGACNSGVTFAELADIDRYNACDCNCQR